MGLRLSKQALDNLDEFEEFIQNSIEFFEEKGYPREDVRIYMPLYFNGFLCKHMAEKYRYEQGEHILKLHDAPVLAGYENKVIIALKDAVLADWLILEMKIP